MSEIAIGSQAQSEKAFSRGMALLIVAVGTLAFIAMLVLGAYAPDLRPGRNGGAHALSNAAIGFSGLVRLAEGTGRNPIIVRSEDQLRNNQLAIVTPDSGTVNISNVVAQLKSLGYVSTSYNGILDVEYGVEAPYGGGQTFAVKSLSVAD